MYYIDIIHHSTNVKVITVTIIYKLSQATHIQNIILIVKYTSFQSFILLMYLIGKAGHWHFIHIKIEIGYFVSRETSRSRVVFIINNV